jgi:TPR repeat protein
MSHVSNTVPVSLFLTVSFNDGRTTPCPIEKLSVALQSKIAEVRRQIFNAMANPDLPLPDKIILNIFLRVVKHGGAKSIYSLMLVSKKWHTLALRSEIWQKIARIQLIDVEPTKEDGLEPCKEYIDVAIYLKELKLNYQLAKAILKQKTCDDKEHRRARNLLLTNAKNLHKKSIDLYLNSAKTNERTKKKSTWEEFRDCLEYDKFSFVNSHQFYSISEACRRGSLVNCSKVKTIYYLKQAAVRGDLHALRNLANCYKTGKLSLWLYSKGFRTVEVKQSIAKYERCLKLSADQRDLEAGFELAKWHLDKGDPKEYAISIHYLKQLKASEEEKKGRPSVLDIEKKRLHLLGKCYAEGKGVEKSMPDAIAQWEEAAALGDIISREDLARIYEDPQSKEQSFEYLKKAADSKDLNAMCHLAKAYASGKFMAASLEKAFDLWKAAADLGHVESLYHLGRAFFFGMGTKQDEKLAVDLLKKAAALGFPAAHYLIGLAYSEGKGVEKSPVQALKIWKFAATGANDPDAIFQLGLCYQEGTHGVAKSVLTAFLLFLKASKQGHVKAHLKLARLFESGFESNGNVVKSPQEAFRYYKLAADQGEIPEAQCKVGLALMTGTGTQKSAEAGIFYLQKAAKQNHADAKSWLALANMQEISASPSEESDTPEEELQETSLESRKRKR